MDQTKSENKIIRRYQQECGADSNPDCDVRVFDIGIHQDAVETVNKHATDLEVVAVELIRKERSAATTSRRPTLRIQGQQSTDDFAVKVNGIVVLSNQRYD